MCGSCQFVYISSEYEIWKELKSTNNHKRKRALHHFFHRCSSGHTILAANIKIHTFKKLLCKCKVEQKTNTRSLTHSHSHNGNAREKKVSRPRTHVPLVIYQRSPRQFYIVHKHRDECQAIWWSYRKVLSKLLIQREFLFVQSNDGFQSPLNYLPVPWAKWTHRRNMLIIAKNGHIYFVIYGNYINVRALYKYIMMLLNCMKKTGTFQFSGTQKNSQIEN